MRNGYFLIWCITVAVVAMLDRYLSFISGYTLWEQVRYSKDVLALSELFNLIWICGVAYILYEPKETK